MITKEIKTKWSEALRSGQYKKIERQLRKFIDGEACYCTLGILGLVMDWAFSESGTDFLVDGENVGYMPAHELLGEDTTALVWGISDIPGFTFEDCANWVDNLETEGEVA